MYNHPQPISCEFWIGMHNTESDEYERVAVYLDRYTPKRDFSDGGATEEGSHYWYEHYTLSDCGTYVTCETGNHGSDCDGRHSEHADYTCQVHELHSVPGLALLPKEDEEPVKGPNTPNWQEVGSGQRDYVAEAMGY